MNNISERQLQVMEILWNADEPMTSKEIFEKCDFSRNTVDASIRRLMKLNYIEACSIVYSGTVLSRAYKSVLTREEFLHTACNSLQSIDTSGEVMQNLIKQLNSIIELDKLLTMIEDKRKELEESDI